MMERFDHLLPGPSFLRTVLLTMGAIAILFSVDTFLARMELAESQVEGARFYDVGRQWMQAGAPEQAVQQFTAARALARNNSEYARALGEAQTAAGRLLEAEGTLDELLNRDATGGPANLAMARVLVKQSRITDAISYYHRAIYGRWGADALARRVQVRFELADLLITRNVNDGLLAELLPLQGEAPDDLETELKLGRLFVLAGSPARGADLFQRVIQKDADNAEAYAGLGEAEFARGNYRRALAYFQGSLRLNPGDDHTQQRIDLCGQVMSLDPTQRGLSVEQQYQRSLKLLELMSSGLRACMDLTSLAEGRDLLDQAAKAMQQRVYPARFSVAYNANLELIEKLWQLGRSRCGDWLHSDQESVALVLNRIAQ